MYAVFDHPVVQGGLAPFVLALVVTLGLQRFRLSGLAIIAGFALTVYLVSGFAIEPLTASRKIIWLGLTAAALALPLNLTSRGAWRNGIALLSAAAAVWMSMRILQQHTLVEAVQWGIGGALYVGCLVYWMDALRNAPLRAASVGMALGFGTGAAALFGASALLGQFGLSLGAAAAAYLLVLVVSKSRLACGRSFTLPLALLAGLVGFLAVLSAQLPWYALLVLAAVPLVGRLPVSDKMDLRLQALLLSGVSLAFAAGAVFLSWRINGAPPL